MNFKLDMQLKNAGVGIPGLAGKVTALHRCKQYNHLAFFCVLQVR